MYIIPWSKVYPEGLIFSSVSDDVAVWDADTTYYKGQLVYGSDGATVYEAAVGPATFSQGQYCGQEHGENLPNVGYNPEEGPTVPAMDRTAYPDYYEVADCYQESGKLWWIKRGPYWENKYRVFSDAPDLLTVGPWTAGPTAISTITFTLAHRARFGAIGFARLNATSIRVQVEDHDQTYDLVTLTAGTLPAGDILRSFIVQVPEVDYLSPITITVIHEMSRRRHVDPNYGQQAQIGYMVLGYLIHIGETLYGTTIGIQDYSKKERDAFGRALITTRGYTNTVKYRISVPTEQIYSLREFLTAQRAVVSMYVGELSMPETFVIGYFKNFTIPIEEYSDSVFDLEVEGI
ncbi:MAG: hypothetical protein EOM21_13640 [Gammaproteobacteria bacterium]|nr:hypothetical protein [Gammaproteobacteria bacterium]